MTIRESFERFQYLNYKMDFLENENIFQKTEVLFLAESKKIENASFPYKTAISTANVQTNNGEYKIDLSQRT